MLDGDIHRSAVLCPKALLSWLNRRQLAAFGKRVSSWYVLVRIVGGGKVAVLAESGYMPQNVC